MAYRMTHPDSTQEIEVDAQVVDTYRSQGWETAASANPPAENTEATPAPPAKPKK